MILFSALQGVKHLFYPHLCAHCGTVELPNKVALCLACQSSIPHTYFHQLPDNPVEKVFWGRLPFHQAASFCYFSKGSIVQNLLHQIKYHGRKELGIYLGQQMGYWLQESPRFADIDLILPLPLHPKRLAERGYNQASLLAEGIADITKTVVREDCLTRPKETQTQTRKHRQDRWQSMDQKFSLNQGQLLVNKHILLVDDLITTGATMEGAGQVFASIPGVRLSLVSFAFAVK
jgi:ComF family protein